MFTWRFSSFLLISGILLVVASITEEPKPTKCFKLQDGITDTLSTTGQAPPTTSVDWWAVWNGENGKGSFYVDSSAPTQIKPLNTEKLDNFLTNHVRMVNDKNAGAFAVTKQFFADLGIAKSDVKPLYRIHETMKKIRKIYVSETIAQLQQTVVPQVKTLAFYFNDQFDEGDTMYQKHFRTAAETPGNTPKFSWKYAHSKSMLAVDVDGFPSTGFILQHSIPQTPGASINDPTLTEQTFLKNHNADAMSQHAFCLSANSADQMRSIIQILKTAGLNFIHANYDAVVLEAPGLWDMMSELSPLLDGMNAPSFTCASKWKEVREKKSWTEVMNSIPPECYTRFDFTPSVQDQGAIVVFGHPQMEHHHGMPEDTITISDQDNMLTDDNNNNNNNAESQPIQIKGKPPRDNRMDEMLLMYTPGIFKDLPIVRLQRLAQYSAKFTKPSEKKRTWVDHPKANESKRKIYIEVIMDASKALIREKQRDKSVHSTYFGPLHWDLVARKLDPTGIIPFKVSCWKNTNLPSMFNVILVNEFSGTKHGRRHEKIGIAHVGQSQTSKHWVCFGDANHRTSEISHAGVTICVQSSGLWQTFNAKIKSVYDPPKEVKSFSCDVNALPNHGKATSVQQIVWRIEREPGCGIEFPKQQLHANTCPAPLG